MLLASAVPFKCFINYYKLSPNLRNEAIPSVQDTFRRAERVPIIIRLFIFL